MANDGMNKEENEKVLNQALGKRNDLILALV